ncbi:MAG: HAD family hydrolase [Spirochaetales bacterium]|nr:HAD family hydrolase [Spirochaetales bacterium]
MEKNRKIKAVAFDKDGTLLDFHFLWVNLLEALVGQLIQKFELDSDAGDIRAKVFGNIGIKDGVIDPLGVYGKGTERDIFNAIYSGFKSHMNNCSPQEFGGLVKLHTTDLLADMTSRVRAVEGGDVVELFGRLKDAGYIVGVVTNDSYKTGKVSLAGLGLDADGLDFFYTGNMKNLQPKPSPQIIEDMMARFNLEASEIMVVGDTPCDMDFAKNGNSWAVGVLTGVATEKDLSKADFIVKNAYAVEELLNERFS